MQTLRKLLLCLTLAALSIGNARADTVQSVLGITYGSGGETTGWIPPSVLMGTLQAVPASWSSQTYDCALNSCLNFPLPAAFAIGAPTARALSLATAYRATTITKPAVVTLNLSSTAALSLAAGTTNTATVVIGATSGVASGTGTTIGSYSNSLTGSLVVGLNIQTQSAQPITFALPAGWFFAILQQTGTVTVGSAFDQALG